MAILSALPHIHVMEQIKLHNGDLPDGLKLKGDIAIDTETMGLNPYRDRLCLVQLRAQSGVTHLVKIKEDVMPKNLMALLEDPDRLKIFHFARFDVAMILKNLGVITAPVWCTKIASKLSRTYTDRHGLKDVTKELLSITLDKQQQSSDWGADDFSPEQQEYAALDVAHLHEIKEKLELMLEREDRMYLAQSCFNFLTTRALLDLEGWNDTDIFAHS